MTPKNSTIAVVDELLVPSLERLMDRFTAVDYAILGLMLLISGAIGLYWAFSDGSEASAGRLLTGDGAISPLAASVSIAGTYISAGFLLSITANIYDYGTMYFAIVGSYGLTIYMTSEFFIPLFHSAKLLTCFQYLEMRFSSTVRLVAVFLYIIQMLSFQAISLFAPAQALSQVTGISEWKAIITIGLVCTLYTSIGGIKAVIYTDCFQCGAILLSMLVIVGFGFYDIGSISEVFATANEGQRIVYDDFRIDPTLSHSFWTLVFGAAVTNLTSYATNQMMVARYLTLSSVKKAKAAAWMSWPILFVVVALSSLSGLLAFARYAECDPLSTGQIVSSDQVLPYYVMEALGNRKGIPGIFALAIFAASLSSVSSAINSLVCVAYVDIIADRWTALSEQTASKLMIALGLFFGLLSIAVVAILKVMGKALETTVAVNSGIGSAILGLFVTGMFLRRVDSRSAILGLLVSLIVSVLMNMGPISKEVDVMEPLPRSVSKCDLSDNFRWHLIENFPTPVTNARTYMQLDDVSHALRISYLWYPAVSLILQVMVSLISSYIFRGRIVAIQNGAAKVPMIPESIRIIA